ncbi:putative zinc ion binding protein [Trypoxylus dichotomus]
MSSSTHHETIMVHSFIRYLDNKVQPFTVELMSARDIVANYRLPTPSRSSSNLGNDLSFTFRVDGIHHVKFELLYNLFRVFRLTHIFYFEDDGEDESDGGWQQELQRRYMQEINFMAELQARNPLRSPEGNNHSATQNFVNQDAHQSFPVTNIVNNGSQNYGSPQTYTPHKFIGHQTPQSLFIPERREDKITMMKKFATYFHEKVLLGNRIGLVEYDLMNYITDGMDNSILQTQAKMKKFKKLMHMLQVMGTLRMMNDERQRTELLWYHQRRTHPHISNRCPKAKRDRFECGSMGH